MGTRLEVPESLPQGYNPYWYTTVPMLKALSDGTSLIYLRLMGGNNPNGLP